MPALNFNVPVNATSFGADAFQANSFQTNSIVLATSFSANGTVGNPGQILVSAGGGNAYWTNVGSIPIGLNDQIAFNNLGTESGDANLMWNTSQAILTVNGSVSIGNATVNVSINSTAFSGISNNSNNFAGQGQSYYANVTSPTFSANVTVGSNVSVNTSTISIGNSTVNTFSNSTHLFMGNSVQSFVVNNGVVTSPTVTSLNSGQLGDRRNKIDNGDMIIYVRGNSPSHGIGGFNITDRWWLSQTFANITYQANVTQAVNTMPGFLNCITATTTSAHTISNTDYSFIVQSVPCWDTYGLQYGTANAQTTTLSFWAWSSVTGTYSGAIRCSNNTAVERSYVYSYSIPVANIWTYVTQVVPGDTNILSIFNTTNVGEQDIIFSLGAGANLAGATTNTWYSNNYVGVNNCVSLAATNGAKFMLTGVQWEIGNTATPYEYYSLMRNYEICSRYFMSVNYTVLSGYVPAGNYIYTNYNFPIMYSIPTVTITGTPPANVGINGGSLNSVTIQWYQPTTVYTASGVSFTLDTGW